MVSKDMMVPFCWMGLVKKNSGTCKTKACRSNSCHRLSIIRTAAADREESWKKILSSCNEKTWFLTLAGIKFGCIPVEASGGWSPKIDIPSWYIDFVSLFCPRLNDQMKWKPRGGCSDQTWFLPESGIKFFRYSYSTTYEVKTEVFFQALQEISKRHNNDDEIYGFLEMPRRNGRKKMVALWSNWRSVS